MRKIAFIIILLFHHVAFAQLKTYKGKSVVDDIKRADSVVLLSHLDSNQEEFYPVIINNSINFKIIKEKQYLGNIAKKELIKIINTAKYKPPRGKFGEIKTTGCYMPHHSVLIYINKEIFHWEICFGCKGMGSNTHDYYREMGEQFDDKKYTLFQTFFKKHGLKYELYK